MNNTIPHGPLANAADLCVPDVMRSRREVVEILRRDNPDARADDISMYADLFVDYATAAENIARNGVIVAHPRTGTPMENPYGKVRADAMVMLRKFVRLKNVSALWE